MSGIAIHTASPINAYNAPRADGVTPRTAPNDTTPTRTNPRASTTTNGTSSTSPYPSAQPGASAVPAPTATAPPPFPYTPTATRTSRSSRSSSIASLNYTPASAVTPPDPQPGAVPTPQSLHSRRPSVPPPPKVGEEVKPAAYYAPQYATPTASPSAAIQQPPPLPIYQQSPLTTPLRAQPPASTTSGHLGGDLAGITFPQDGQASPFQGHNPYAGVANQNISGGGSNVGGIIGNNAGGFVGHSGFGGQGSSFDDEKASVAGLWESTVSWVKKAGEKLQEGEQEIWRQVNGKSR